MCITLFRYGMGKPTHTLVPCWMSKPFPASKEKVYKLFRPSHLDYARLFYGDPFLMGMIPEYWLGSRFAY